MPEVTTNHEIARVSPPGILMPGETTTRLTGSVYEPVYVWTREDIANAVNNGADLVGDELGSERDTDLLNMVVNAVLTLLDNPHYTLDEVITECYDEDPEEVRSWWTGWS
ncbi:hypothetical protein ACIQ6V_15500 [Streptomyces sp. NPDC096198]|uniref:hypothetical protein n=1 Tax=Streptomyces sp. NPDC096198 TaxID=3366080 RepID=UPI0038022271